VRSYQRSCVLSRTACAGNWMHFPIASAFSCARHTQRSAAQRSAAQRSAAQRMFARHHFQLRQRMHIREVLMHRKRTILTSLSSFTAHACTRRNGFCGIWASHTSVVCETLFESTIRLYCTSVSRQMQRRRNCLRTSSLVHLMFVRSSLNAFSKHAIRQPQRQRNVTSRADQVSTNPGFGRIFSTATCSLCCASDALRICLRWRRSLKLTLTSMVSRRRFGCRERITQCERTVTIACCHLGGCTHLSKLEKTSVFYAISNPDLFTGRIPHIPHSLSVFANARFYFLTYNADC
jgi:hypothetical protein